MSGFLALVSRKHAKVMRKLENPPRSGEIGDISAAFVVSIEYDAPEHDRMNYFTGAGILIDKQWVLTCAHIFDKALDSEDSPFGNIPTEDKKFYVRIGSQDIGKGAMSEIDLIKPHPDYRAGKPRKRGTGSPDLALLRLKEPVSNPVATMAANPLVDVLEPAIVLGWTRGQQGTGRLSRVDTVLLPPFIGMGGGATIGDACLANTSVNDMDNGFSGGPVLAYPPGPEHGEPLVVGIVSRGVKRLSSAKQYGKPAIAVDLIRQAAFIYGTVQAHQRQKQDAS